jgi:hypothetical protein
MLTLATPAVASVAVPVTAVSELTNCAAVGLETVEEGATLSKVNCRVVVLSLLVALSVVVTVIV